MSTPAATEQAGAAPARTTVIEPPSGWSLPPLRDITQSFDLIYFLAKRDIIVRYKQTAVGALWAVLQPLLLAGVFSVFLGQLANVPSGHTPYALFALTGMTMWLFFATSIARASESTLVSGEMISKVYFPRIVIPIAAVSAPVADFVAAFVVLVVVLLIGGIVPPATILLVPVVFLVAMGVAIGLGLWLSATVVRYRDVSLTVPFMIQVLLFTTPILYPLSLIPESYRWVYSLNPLVGVMETFRWAMLPGAEAPGLLMLVPVVTAVVLLLSGLLYFNRAQRYFADFI